MTQLGLAPTPADESIKAALDAEPVAVENLAAKNTQVQVQDAPLDAVVVVKSQRRSPVPVFCQCGRRRPKDDEHCRMCQARIAANEAPLPAGSHTPGKSPSGNGAKRFSITMGKESFTREAIDVLNAVSALMKKLDVVAEERGATREDLVINFLNSF